mmetsp:Transcript_5509/g.16439  ORF Transcript_5509/g.16439 Transcript_5509/m.16439 type:complete len:242 (+) Transcript_5509:70-795(+)|eukprot:CAMPEP_0198733788 /NCGR_PEP_ID=MMETSP1475-20131203/48249_1 /TAXON_ID= ORGANISM="Unidentified sp., Strain CCMP1999" /NCGR_SAMPLE_ID=MMETSP1475 /ASSEMBLY_ACC=CAM_ASM_001111 /LENGTH=241 /DNA_ID=CAMNT_0044497141 /DNA_START=9 /DNA_END=734 /DNA_ORIENTATION=+
MKVKRQPGTKRHENDGDDDECSSLSKVRSESRVAGRGSSFLGETVKTMSGKLLSPQRESLRPNMTLQISHPDCERTTGQDNFFNLTPRASVCGNSPRSPTSLSPSRMRSTDFSNLMDVATANLQCSFTRVRESSPHALYEDGPRSHSGTVSSKKWSFGRKSELRWDDESCHKGSESRFNDVDEPATLGKFPLLSSRNSIGDDLVPLRNSVHKSRPTSPGPDELSKRSIFRRSMKIISLDDH